jgi:hypothetical protein
LARNYFFGENNMARKLTHRVTVTEPITLEDLRWLVEQCADLAGNSKVEIKEHKSYSQMDWDSAEISVVGS